MVVAKKAAAKKTAAPAAEPEVTEIKFNFSRETTGAYRFDEVVPEGEEKIVGALYIRKVTVPPDFKPEGVKVTLELF